MNIEKFGCTRNCRFCAVDHGPLGPLDPREPVRVAEAAQSMGLSYVVVTSVTRDDLPDDGAGPDPGLIYSMCNQM